jgi:guanylate kinase
VVLVTTTHPVTRPSRSVLAVIGPSASGKSSLVRELHGRGIVRVHPTWTTRPRRPDELAGSPEHRFVSDDTFDALAARGFFLDTVEMFGLPYRYGLPALASASAGGLVDAVMLRAPLVDRFTALVGRPLVYQVEDTSERPCRRLLERGSDRAEVVARLDDNVREIALGREVADRVFANDGSLDDLADAVAAALAVDVSRVEVA